MRPIRHQLPSHERPKSQIAVRLPMRIRAHARAVVADTIPSITIVRGCAGSARLMPIRRGATGPQHQGQIDTLFERTKASRHFIFARYFVALIFCAETADVCFACQPKRRYPSRVDPASIYRRLDGDSLARPPCVIISTPRVALRGVAAELTLGCGVPPPCGEERGLTNQLRYLGFVMPRPWRENIFAGRPA